MITKQLVFMKLFFIDTTDNARAHVQRRLADDRGVTLLEIAVVGLGLFLLAGAVVAVIVAAVNSRMSQIN